MSRPKTPTKPPGGGAVPGQKPFLGDEDLFSELEAWDATFDALHTDEGAGAAGGGGGALDAAGDLGDATALVDLGAEGQGGPDAEEFDELPGVAEEEPALPPRHELADLRRPPEPRGLDRLGSEFDAVATGREDEDLVVDGGTEGEIEDGIETRSDEGGEGGHVEVDDGSDEGGHVGIDDEVDDGVDTAGDVGIEDEDDDAGADVGGETRIVPGLVIPAAAYGGDPAYAQPPTQRRPPTMTSVEHAHLEDPLEADFSDLRQQQAGRSTRRTMPPPLDDDDDLAPSRRTRTPSDDDVYTSASRPNPVAPPGRYEDDDEIAPPPPPTAPEPRRGPAIVRRSVQQPVARDESQVTPPHGLDVAIFAERTRLSDGSELLEAVQATRSTHAGDPLDDDAYDDIEIGAEEAAAAAAAQRGGASTSIGVPAAPVPAADSFSAGRRTAHVLRRTDTPTRPPAIVQQRDDDDDDDEDIGGPHHARTVLASEEDFSDVAAAVGATDDVDAAAAAIAPPRRPRHNTFDFELDEDRRPPALETALSDLDDAPAADFTGDAPADFENEGGSAEFERALSPGLQPGALSTFVDAAPPPPALDPARDQSRPVRPAMLHAETQKGIPAFGEGRLPARPPALTDLYPSRVKTPTSVPPLGRPLPPYPTTPLLEPPPEDAPRRPPPPVRALPGEPAVSDELEPTLDLEVAGRSWPEQVTPETSATLDEACAASLLVYERELATLDDGAASAALRIDAGRLCERLADLERARTHYDAALLADPRATAALRGLRRIARAAGDLVEATRLLDSEIAVAGALERRPLGHYRIDLLMASGEQDLARVAVGELLDTAPSDVRALLAHLELAFLDGRADEFGAALEQLAHAVTDHELRAAAQSARGALAAQQNDNAAAMGWFTAAAAADPGALAARLGAVRYAAAEAQSEAAAGALLDLARQLEQSDPTTASAAALRAQQWVADAATAAPGPNGEIQAPVAAELYGACAQLASAASPSDPLVARLAAEASTATAAADPVGAAAAFAYWAACASAPAERAYAAARAAELDGSRGAELWSAVLELDPGDDYAAAQLRTAHVSIEATEASIEVDIAVSADAERDRARLRAAYGQIAVGKLDAAIELLGQGRAQRPGSLAIAEALGEAYAAAGNWTARAKLFAELAAEPGEQLDREVAQLRSAVAWEEAVGAAAAVAEVPAGDEEPPDLPAVIASALDAWERVLAADAAAPAAHAAAILLASRLGDRDTLADVLSRAQAAERSPWAAASLGLRRSRLYGDDPQHVEDLLRNLLPAEDPRRTVGLVMTAARMKDLGDAAAALEERSRVLDERSSATEVAALRLRAAQLALDAGDAARATRLLGRVEQALPGLGVVPDLLAAARRRAGDRPTVSTARRSEPPPGTSTAEAFARIVRDADLALAQGDGAAALSLYQRALELRPGDPLATVPLIRVATQLREPAAVTALALAQLRAAEEAGDGPAKAAAYELLAHVDAELRIDPESAQVALESASGAEPGRIDLLHRLERQYAVVDEVPELLRLRRAALEAIPSELARDRASLLLDIAGLATRDNHAEVELADLYRKVLEADPAVRLALLHLESIVRRAGLSEELAQLEEKIATFFEGDARTQAAFWTRAGETLAELGQIDGAVQRFGKAEAALPGHVPALEGWRQAALKGQLWVDVAEAAIRQADGTTDDAARAQLHHFAGVALMDKALVGDRAMTAFQRALEAEPGHRDSFLRLRILLEEDADHDELAALLGKRLEVETDADARIELHRALAELHRNFLSDRDTAKEHFRAILARDPNDLRSHAAIADIAWEQGNWQEAAEALMSRARLEREPEVLKTLCFRLGLIYSERLVDPPMALKAFQRALTYQPDDENTLVRLADLATQVGEFKLALGACERLVKNEADADRRVAHLHRVAKIFKHGFNDAKRAERALNLALDGAPTNDEALQQLVQFYKDARDITSVRVHLNRVAGSMRARVQQAPLEGLPYRVISRAMAARAATGFAGSTPIARAAAELADQLGEAGEPEQKLLGDPVTPDLSLLVKPDADEVLFPRGVQLELRQIFQLLGDRIAKHVGVDLRPYGATRGDRLRARDNPVAAVAQSVATALGFGDIDVYVSQRQPWVMVAEPTSPVSLIIGSSIAAAGGDAIRFAAGGALKLAQVQLAIPARLPAEDLGVLVVALMRLFQPDFPMLSVDPDGVATQLQKLKRLIPTSLLNELRPYALAIDSQRFGHRELARDLKVTGLRAGLVASGSLLVGLRILAGQAQAELPAFLADPVAQGLISFALSEDHAAVAR